MRLGALWQTFACIISSASAQGYWFDRKGRVIASDGSVVLLNNGEMVTFAGEHLPIPPGVAFP